MKRHIVALRGNEWKEIQMKNLLPGDLIRILDDVEYYDPDEKWKVIQVPKILDQEKDVWGIECVKVNSIRNIK